MESHSHEAQRVESSAESRHSIEVSQTQQDFTLTPPPTLVHGTRGQEPRSHSKNFKELRQLGAVDFYDTIDPVEAATWLRRTERVFGRMKYTLEEQFDFAVSLL